MANKYEQAAGKIKIHMKNEKSNTKEVYLISNQRSLKDTRLYAYQNNLFYDKTWWTMVKFEGIGNFMGYY